MSISTTRAIGKDNQCTIERLHASQYQRCAVQFTCCRTPQPHAATYLGRAIFSPRHSLSSSWPGYQSEVLNCGYNVLTQGKTRDHAASAFADRSKAFGSITM